MIILDNWFHRQFSIINTANYLSIITIGYCKRLTSHLDNELVTESANTYKVNDILFK